MIETVTAYKVGNQTFSTLEEAQMAKVSEIVHDSFPELPKDFEKPVAAMVVLQFSRFATVLQTTAQKPKIRKPRKDKGQKRKKTAPSEEVCGITVEGSGKYAGK